MFRIIVVLVMSLGLTSMAHAKKGGGACAKDIETFCKDVAPGGGNVAKCMMDNADKLSTECKAQQEKWKEARNELKEACHDDLDKYCSDVDPGKGRLFKCMKKHHKELSETCQAQMTELKKTFKR